VQSPAPVPVILIVDVDPDTHTLAEGTFAENECVVLTSRSAEMALKLAERRPPAVLVVGDRIAGLAYLGERLRRLTPHLHIVLLTSADKAMDAVSHRQAGVGTVLARPVDSVRFRATVRTVLRLSAMSAGVKRMHRADSSPSIPVAAPPRSGREK
jgi:DNA-binding response OmpR family regulator